VGLPTDCPQRDERLGWTGDIQVFAPAAAFLYDATGVLQGWLKDLRDEQVEYGSVLNFHPWVDCGFPFDVSAGWGDAAVHVPWVVHRMTGDRGILERQWPYMYPLANKKDGSSNVASSIEVKPAAGAGPSSRPAGIEPRPTAPGGERPIPPGDAPPPTPRP